MIFIDFPRNLKEIRKIRGLTQEELSKILNVNLNTYRHYEHGDTEPKYEILEKIKIALDCSYDDLLK